MTIILTITEIENSSSRTFEKYLYRVVPHNNGVVFSDVFSAHFTSQINKAILESKTWGEFKKLLPPGELEDIIKHFFEEGYYEELGVDEDDIDVDEIDYLPFADTDEFDRDQVPGVVTASYPEWLQPDMDYILPEAFIEKFGVRKDTFLDGSYWEFSPKQLPEMIQYLEDLGHEVESGEHLCFY